MAVAEADDVAAGVARLGRKVLQAAGRRALQAPAYGIPVVSDQFLTSSSVPSMPSGPLDHRR